MKNSAIYVFVIQESKKCKSKVNGYMYDTQL